MNKTIIYKYIDRITKNDIKLFGIKQNINLSNNELDLIYDSIKNNPQRIINHTTEVIDEIKDKISMPLYYKLLELYDKYRFFLNK